LARQGLEVERQARPITVYSLEILDYAEETGELTLDCQCSKGTYIRTICHDIGAAIGCGAVMTALRRTMALDYTLKQCITLEQARELASQSQLEERLLSVESAFTAQGKVTVTAAQAVRFSNGGALLLDRLTVPVSGLTRVYAPDEKFLGLGKTQDGELKVAKLF
jgi:tRNA pseudouridine55 synthase